MFFKILLSIVVGYAFGSVMSAIIISKLVYREDVRKQGSGNSGATNAARVYGFLTGLFTYLGDFLKGIAACLLGRLIGGWALESGVVCMAVAGFAAIIGHSFPILWRFRGGKGVATGSALALMLDWRIFVIALCAFIILVVITRIVSVGSIAACVAVAAGSAIFVRNVPAMILGIAASLVVILMHWQNIDRLLKGTEKRFVFGKPKPIPRVK